MNAQATTPAVTVNSGSLALTVQSGSSAAGATTAMPTAPWTGMLPGDIVGQQLTLASTGSAGSTVTARLSAVTTWDIRIAPGTCPATQLSSSPMTTNAVSIGSLASGTNTVYCVQAVLPSTVAASVQGMATNFSILIDSTQVPS